MEQEAAEQSERSSEILMRYITPLFFVQETEKRYDPDSGEWTGGEPIRTKRRANVTHMGAERQQAVFGDVRSNRFVVRLQRAFAKPYDYIEMGGKTYTVDTGRCPGDKHSLVVIENVGN